MPRRKIPLIDIIKINSKKILDIISKYEGGIDEITDGLNKYCSKKTPNPSIFKKHSYDYRKLNRFKQKARDASATIIYKLIKRKLVKIEPVVTKENNVNKEVVQEEPVMSIDDNICVNEKIHDPLPQDYRSNFQCSSCNSCNTSNTFVTNFHDGIDASIFSVHDQHNDSD